MVKKTYVRKKYPAGHNYLRNPDVSINDATRAEIFYSKNVKQKNGGCMYANKAGSIDHALGVSKPRCSIFVSRGGKNIGEFYKKRVKCTTKEKKKCTRCGNVIKNDIENIHHNKKLRKEALRAPKIPNKTKLDLSGNNVSSNILGGVDNAPKNEIVNVKSDAPKAAEVVNAGVPVNNNQAVNQPAVAQNNVVSGMEQPV
jgi:hypothetical protein